jgi:hypothetical protein
MRIINFSRISITKIFFSTAILYSLGINGQSYPDPEFNNEVYCLQKDNTPTLIRLEKKYAKQETKTKLAGFTGTEYGYTIQGDKSNIRINKTNKLSFIYFLSHSRNNKSDSVMKTNGMDQNPYSTIGIDPTTMISLYKTDIDKSDRKIFLVKNKGMFGAKNKGSDKYTFSIKQIRDGYWEFVPDKPLPIGEYSFVVMGFNTDGSHTLFSFGID